LNKRHLNNNLLNCDIYSSHQINYSFLIIKYQIVPFCHIQYASIHQDCQSLTNKKSVWSIGILIDIIK